MSIVIRVWNGNTVAGVVSFGRNGSSSFIGDVGGAANSTKPDIEIDPWAGTIVDHRTDMSPVSWIEADRHECEPPGLTDMGMETMR